MLHQQPFQFNVDAPDRLHRIEQALDGDFTYSWEFGCWLRRDGTACDEFDVGWRCFYTPLTPDDLTSAAMRSGYDYARGEACYRREMERDAIEQQRWGWLS